MSQAIVDKIYKDLHDVDERNAKKIDDLAKTLDQAQRNIQRLNDVLDQAQKNIEELRKSK